jgi:hypothetical protein
VEDDRATVVGSLGGGFGENGIGDCGLDCNSSEEQEATRTGL